MGTGEATTMIQFSDALKKEILPELSSSLPVNVNYSTEEPEFQVSVNKIGE